MQATLISYYGITFLFSFLSFFPGLIWVRLGGYFTGYYFARLHSTGVYIPIKQAPRKKKKIYQRRKNEGSLGG